MGDFDRHDNSARKGETKKMVTLLVLGTALIGLLGSQMIKKGPQPAMGGQANAGFLSGVAPGADDTPESALKDLQKDPTRTLLHNDPKSDAALNKIPRNPFRMTDAWHQALVRIDPTPVVTQVVTPTTVPAETHIVKPAPVPLKIEDYKVAMIYSTGGKYSAIVNGKQVFVGMVVDKARVLDIRAKKVTLLNIESPEAPAIDIVIP